MLIRNVAPLALILSGVSAQGDTAFATFKAEITELNGSGVNATALIFAGKEGGLIGYGGFAEGLASDLEAATVSEVHRVGVSFVKLIDSQSMYTSLSLYLLFFFSSPFSKSALQRMGVASTFTLGIVVRIVLHKVTITMKIRSWKIRGLRPATRVTPMARRRSRGLWILARMMSKEEHL